MICLKKNEDEVEPLFWVHLKEAYGVLSKLWCCLFHKQGEWKTDNVIVTTAYVLDNLIRIESQIESVEQSKKCTKCGRITTRTRSRERRINND